MKRLHEGWLVWTRNGEKDDLLGLMEVTSGTDILAEELEYLDGHQTTVRYFICDRKTSLEDAEVAIAALTLGGVADAEYGVAYSECTGYLWTDEELKVGGHDLLAELKSHVGKYLLLDVEVHD